MDFRRFLSMSSVTTPSAVVLFFSVGVDSYLWPISSSAWRSGVASWQLMKRATSSASAAEYMTALIICTMVMTAPLFDGMADLLDMKKFPPALLRGFFLEI